MQPGDFNLFDTLEIRLRVSKIEFDQAVAPVQRNGFFHMSFINNHPFQQCSVRNRLIIVKMLAKVKLVCVSKMLTQQHALVRSIRDEQYVGITIGQLHVKGTASTEGIHRKLLLLDRAAVFGREDVTMQGAWCVLVARLCVIYAGEANLVELYGAPSLIIVTTFTSTPRKEFEP